MRDKLAHRREAKSLQSKAPRKIHIRLTPTRRKKALASLTAHPNMRMASDAAGVSHQTLLNHIAADPEFRAAVDEALTVGLIMCRAAIQERMLLGPLPKGTEPKPVEYDADGLPIIDAQSIDLDAAKWLLSYHGNAVERRRAAAQAGPAVPMGKAKGVAPIPIPEIATPEETNALIAEVIAKFDAAAAQKRHEGRLKRQANREAHQAKQVAKRRARKKAG